MNNTNPTARIGVNRNLVPTGTNVYLKSGQEFEIELYNPTQYNVLAKIYINGEAVSDSGLIIKPGRREWLERYIDKPRKFKFDTYEVEAGNSDVKAAIKNNGSIKIEFYKEKTKNDGSYLILDGSWNNWNKPFQPIPNWQMPPSFPPQPDIWFGPSYNPIYGGTITTSNGVVGTTVNGTKHKTTLNADNSLNLFNCSTTNVNAAYSSNTIAGDFNFSNDMLKEESMPELNMMGVNSVKSAEPKLEETGRIEAGSKSSQTFTYVDMDFELWVLSRVEYKLLPLSKKPVVASEINVYCTSCSTKQKKSSWKFCPTCGGKFE